MKKFPTLFSPFQLGRLTLKNRIISAPTSLAEVGPNGTLSAENIAYYRRKAKGGAAVVMVGESVVHAATGLSHPQQVVLNTPTALPSLMDCADAIHQYDAYAGIELGHGGKQCAPVFLQVPLPIGPSDLFDENGRQTCQGMDKPLMDEIVKAYADSAKNCAAAGFNIICVHGGHGWLIGQFLSPLSNHRSDEYGGSLDNRCRYVIEILQAIRKAAPRCVLEIRVSGDELTQRGYHIDEGVEICKLLEPWVDDFHVSVGVNEDLFTSIVMHPSMFLDHGCNVKYAAAVKAAVKKPVICVGGISDADQMEEILTSGQADLIGVARGLIADPDLPNKARKGHDGEIRHCLRCYGCQEQMFKTRNIRCAVNPVIGYDLENENPAPAVRKKKLAVVGGGPSGMQCAITAAQRGHDVTLYEADKALGGKLQFAQYIPFKRDLYRFAQWQMGQLEKYGVKVLLNTSAEPEKLEAMDYDVIYVAVGASSIRPPFPGMDDSRVVMGTDVYTGGKEIGHRVVLIGGGLVGCETGLHLAQTGHDVTIVEMLPEIASDTSPAHRRAMKVAMGQCAQPPRLCTGHKCQSIQAQGVIVLDPEDREVTLPADTIIVAVGMRSNSAVADGFRGTDKDLIIGGDCTKPAKVLQAVRAGYNAAMSL